MWLLLPSVSVHTIGEWASQALPTQTSACLKGLKPQSTNPIAI